MMTKVTPDLIVDGGFRLQSNWVRRNQKQIARIETETNNLTETKSEQSREEETVLTFMCLNDTVLMQN